MICRWVLILLCLLCSSCVWNENAEDLGYLPLDDSEYPYAGLPRLVIETENARQIRDRETKIPAHLQIYGKQGPESEILDLTVKGRGNSSFTGMPKWSIKLKFEQKQALFGMPKDKEWALIANSADKTLLKNFITYKLAWWLGDDYAPRTKFVELYLNREYMGVYLLTETVKVGKNRVNIAETDSSFLLELGSTPKDGEVHVITRFGTNFTFKHPKSPSDSSKQLIRNQLIDWEYYLHDQRFTANNPVDRWLDVEDYFRYYWIQELSKNLDGAFHRSIFVTWEKGGKFKLGPVWDFDVAYGNWTVDTLRHPRDWYIRSSGWNNSLLTDSAFWERAKDYWKENQPLIQLVNDSLDVYAEKLSDAVNNEFKRWPVLENTENWTYKEAYVSHKEAVDSLKSWINQRINWINDHL